MHCGAIKGATVVLRVVGIVRVRQPIGHDGLCGSDCADAVAARRVFSGEQSMRVGHCVLLRDVGLRFDGSDFLFPLKQSQDTTTYWRFTFPEHYETQTLTPRTQSDSSRSVK